MVVINNETAEAASKFPTPHPTKPYWESRTTHSLANYRSTSDLPPECDVLIIGMGYAGVSAAYNLVKTNPSTSITLLEARSVCSGATGRKGGHLRPDLYEQIPKYIQRYGIDYGVQWAEFELAHMEAIAELIAEEQIDCDFTLTRSTDAWLNEDAAKAAKATYDLLVSLQVRYTNDIDFVCGPDKDGIVKGVKASATYEAASLDPYKLILTLLQRVLEIGKHVNLQTNTPATGLHEDLANGGWIVDTPRGPIKAKKIVHASNAYVSTLLPEYAKSIIPCRGICTHVAVPEGKLAAQLTNLYVIRDAANVLSYLIPLSGGTNGVIVGGSSRLFRPFPEQWYNTVDDSTLIEASNGFFDKFMQRTFYGWENSGAYVKQAWTGVMGYSFDSLPHLGEVPGKLGQYIVAGFNGHGMPVVWLAAKGIAEMIESGKAYEDVKYLPSIAKTSAQRIQTAQEGQEGGDIFN